MATSDMATAYRTAGEAPKNRARHSFAAPALPQVCSWNTDDAGLIDTDTHTRRGEQPYAPSEKAEEHATVLVVDDETSIARLLGELLESADYRVLLAYSGHAGLELARSERPALILTDCMMPGLDGGEFVRRLRGSPVTNTIPVVMMSSVRPKLIPREGIAGLRAPESHIMRSVRRGVSLVSIGDARLPFIEKPFDIDVVLSVVETATKVTDLDG